MIMKDVGESNSCLLTDETLDLAKELDETEPNITRNRVI